MSNRPPLWYIIQSIIGTLLDELVLVAIILWVLPHFDVHLPLWMIVILVVSLAAIDYVRYRWGRMTFFLPLRGHVEAMVGCEGVVTRPLDPVGYVKIQGILWKATCEEGTLEKGTPIIVMEIDGLKLRVTPKKRLQQTK